MSNIQSYLTILDNTALTEYALAKKRADFTSLNQLAMHFIKNCPCAKNKNKTELSW